MDYHQRALNHVSCNEDDQLNREQRERYARHMDADQFINRIISLISLE